MTGSQAIVHCVMRSITDRIHWVTVLVPVNSCLNLVFTHSYRIKVSEF